MNSDVNPDAIDRARIAVAEHEADQLRYSEALAARAAASGMRRVILGAKAALIGITTGYSGVAVEVAEYDATHPAAQPDVDMPQLRTNGDL